MLLPLAGGQMHGATRPILGALLVAAIAGSIAGCAATPPPRSDAHVRPAWPHALAATDATTKRRPLPSRVHHLNCASNAPLSRWLVNGQGGLFEPGHTVCHVLLVESSAGLVLVDTGLGRRDIERPEQRFGWSWFFFVRPRLDAAETAAAQLRRLGFDPADVKHVVLTHLDIDHAGGLEDFPQARVHLHASELERADPRSGHYHARSAERWRHSPRWQPHRPSEPWFGFASAEIVPGIRPSVRLVSLPGHTVGHAGVAVDQGESRLDSQRGVGGAGWLLHAGDAYFHRAEVDRPQRWCPPGLEVFQAMRVADPLAWANTQSRLRALASAQASRVRVFSAHDPVELEAIAPSPERLAALAAAASSERPPGFTKR